VERHTQNTIIQIAKISLRKKTKSTRHWQAEFPLRTRCFWLMGREPVSRALKLPKSFQLSRLALTPLRRWCVEGKKDENRSQSYSETTVSFNISIRIIQPTRSVCFRIPTGVDAFSLTPSRTPIHQLGDVLLCDASVN
jgi:hypothetical protein